MILDALDQQAGTPWDADLCVVGAGAAGIALALQFVGTKTRVLLLESGGFGVESATQALYAGSVSDAKLHSPPDRYRQRRFGGTTTIWGGRCMPFDGIDFEPRDYVSASGWPFGIETLTPFYGAANRLCEAGDYDYDANSVFTGRSKPMIPGFSEGHFSSDSLERISCPTDFGVRYRRQLADADNVTVMLHANVTTMELHPAGASMRSLSFKTLTGKIFVVNARQFVLATGGLEIPRLLLANQSVHTAGIGNDRDVVGRFYMCHLAGTIGSIDLSKASGPINHGYEISEEGIYCRRRLALRAETQKASRIGNFIARLHHPRITDPGHRSAILSMLYMAMPLIPYEYAKRLHGEANIGWRGRLRHLRNVASGPFDAAAFALHIIRDRTLADRKFPSIIIASKMKRFSLDFHAEQQPNHASRVSLDHERDCLGTPRIAIDWRYSAADTDTVTRALELLKHELEASAVGTFEYDADSVELEMTRYGAYGGHHIGTARMGSDPSMSVVDADCRVHGLDNLYLSGAATFPTSSQANPTLTIVALALRLAQRLANVMNRSTPSVATEIAANDLGVAVDPVLT